MDEKLNDKFIVIKKEDVEKYLNDKGKTALYHCLEVISDARSIDGKKNNSYLVVNVDEPYAELVRKLILGEITVGEIKKTNLNLKIFQFDDGEQHWIVAKNKEDAIDWYEGEYIDDDVLKDGYEVNELPRDTKMEVYIAEDINLVNIINKYRNQKEKVVHANIWLCLSYWILEEALRGNEFEVPNLIASSVY